MSFSAIIVRNIKSIFAFYVIMFGVLYQDYLHLICNHAVNFIFGSESSRCENNEILYTQKQLASYNGIENDFLYLSLMGNVYDVTKGRKHYSKGGAYHYFVGKDGSRAFITGNFKDFSSDKDHVLDLSCEDLFALFNWVDTFKRKYDEVGKLEGKYFNKDCKETEYAAKVAKRITTCQKEKLDKKEQEKQYPPCNIAWTVDEGSQVWCTKESGGISRRWVGVPRQLYTPGIEKPRCVCVNPDKEHTVGMFKQYDNCLQTSNSCTLGKT